MEKVSELETAIAALEKARQNIDLEIMRLAAKLPNPSKRTKCVEVFDPFKKVKENGSRATTRRKVEGKVPQGV